MSEAARLGIRDEQFLIESVIERCPRIMMLREIYQNALEAAALSTGEKKVLIGAAVVNGVRKLRLWNTGPGMDPIDLYEMCDLSSSIGKVKSLDRNFGIGAKVASLPSNHLGVRFRSCTEGRVYQVVIGKRNGVYGRLLSSKPEVRGGTAASRPVEIADVSAEVLAAGANLDTDWTEVVLLGMREDQDTCADPFDGDPAVDAYWVPKTLFHRYFRTPSSVTTVIEPGLQWFPEPRTFNPLDGRRQTFEQSETVETERGIKVHFFHDPAHPKRSWENQSSEGALQPSITMLAVAWRNELYDVQSGSPWFYDAPRYGITFGARHLSVVIELPDGYDVIPEMYRQFLCYRSDTQGHVRAFDFVNIVMRARPDWVRKLARAGYSNYLADQADKLSTDLKTLATHVKFVPPKIADDVEPSDGKTAATNRLVNSVKRACGIEPVLLRDANDVRDRWLEGRAAVYYAETAQVFINMLFESRAMLAEAIVKEVSPTSDDEGLAQKIADAADYYYIRRVLRSLIVAQAKSSNPLSWNPDHIQRASSPEALSTATADLEDYLTAAISMVRSQPAK